MSNAVNCAEIRVPWHSKSHPVIPKLYVQPWTQDIVNRPILYKNAKDFNVPVYEHDDALYLNNREQLKYNMESRSDIEAKTTKMPTRQEMMSPEFHDVNQKYRSNMLARYHDYSREELEHIKARKIVLKKE